MEDEKLCTSCMLIKPVKKMGKYKHNGKTYVESMCYACRYKRDIGVPGNKQKLLSRTKRFNKEKRKSDPHVYIVYDSRKSDKKFGRDNDITKEFVFNTIKNGCSYCGETNIRMTLDRIDNNIGHLQSNVVSACIRCNLARRAMPYEAWLVVAKGMKEARELGLFGSWNGRSDF